MLKGSPEDKQPSGPCIRGSAKISWRVTLALYTGSRHPPRADTPWEQTTHQEQTSQRATTPPPRSRHAPRSRPPEQNPQEQTHRPGADTSPPADGYCCRQYASYWNAFLFYSLIWLVELISSLKFMFKSFTWKDSKKSKIPQIFRLFFTSTEIPLHFYL